MLPYIKNEKLFHVLSYIAQVILPACATLYFSLGDIWVLPYVDEVTKTIIAVDTFLGVVLRISTMNYNEEVNSWSVKK